MRFDAFYSDSVTAIRTLLHARCGAVAALVAAALLLRMLVPGGYMPVLDGTRMIVRVCNMAEAARMVIEIPRVKHKPADEQVQNQCAFADLSMPAFPGADPVQLAALAAFVVALGLRFSIARSPYAILRIRPPLRGPPTQP